LPTRPDVRRGVLRTALLGLALLSGCPPTPDHFQAGELGKGTFAYACVNGTDLTCGSDEFTVPFVVAVGGRFGAKFQTNKGEALNVTIPTTELVTRADGSFRAIAPGMFPLLAVDGNSRVIDFKHVQAKKISDIHLVSTDDQVFPSSFRLAVGSTQTFTVEALGDDGAQLRGALDYTWRGLDDALDISAPNQRGEVRVTAKREGTSAIEIGVLDRTFRIDVNMGSGRFADASANLPGLDASIDGAIIDEQTDAGAP